MRTKTAVRWHDVERTFTSKKVPWLDIVYRTSGSFTPSHTEGDPYDCTPAELEQDLVIISAKIAGVEFDLSGEVFYSFASVLLRALLNEDPYRPWEDPEVTG